MKSLIKWIVMAVVLNTAVVMAQSNIKVVADFPGKSKGSGDLSGSVDTKMGFTVGAEFMKPVHNNVAAGGGIQYQLPRGAKDANGKFNFVPIYGVATFFPEYGNGAYGKVTLGYNLHMGDSDYKGSGELSGGLCYGLGGGYILNKKFFVEAMYSINKGGYEISDFDLSGDVTYSRITVGVGIVLGAN
ncbi:hypothetical protein L6Q79_11475 [bacterium]|nr:hypothetical protein [bacterium]NUN46372.1 hypothetical protein [bacterium]